MQIPWNPEGLSTDYFIHFQANDEAEPYLYTTVFSRPCFDGCC